MSLVTRVAIMVIQCANHDESQRVATVKYVSAFVDGCYIDCRKQQQTTCAEQKNLQGQDFK